MAVAATRKKIMDKKKKIELEVLNISNSQEQAGAYALVLGEVDGARQLPVIIGAAEAQAMLISLKGIVPPRPLTHNLFASCLEVLGVNMMRALIYRVDNGVFYSYIYLKADDAIIRMDARTSDAVAMALRMKAPIFIYEEILESEQLKTGKETSFIVFPSTGCTNPGAISASGFMTKSRSAINGWGRINFAPEGEVVESIKSS